MKYYNSFRTILIALICFVQSGCGPSSVNPYTGELTSFDSNGVKSKTDYFTMKEPEEIHIYTETSGSMNYLYRPGCATDFKYNFSALILNFQNKVREVGIFDGKNRVYYLPASVFHDSMNHGILQKTYSTPIPRMLDTVLCHLQQNVEDIAILISDMKYAPSSNITVAKNHYRLEIESKFHLHQELSVALIGMESEAYSSSNKLITDAFPYYMLIIGKAEKVAWVKDQIMQMKLKKVSGVSDFNVNYACPNYTILPSSVIGMADNYFANQNNPRKYSLINYDKEMYSEFVIAIDARHLAGHGTLSSISAYWPQTKVTMSQIPSYKLSASDKAACQNMIPDTFIKVNIQGFEQDCEKFSLMYEPSKDDGTAWITKYYGGVSESNFPLTVSIEDFIKGLKDAYKTYNIQNNPIEVLISKF